MQKTVAFLAIEGRLAVLDGLALAGRPVVYLLRILFWVLATVGRSAEFRWCHHPATPAQQYGGVPQGVQQAATNLVAASGADLDIASQTVADRIRQQLHEVVNAPGVKAIKAALLILIDPSVNAKVAAERAGTSQPTLRRLKPLVERMLGVASLATVAMVSNPSAGAAVAMTAVVAPACARALPNFYNIRLSRSLINADGSVARTWFADIWRDGRVHTAETAPVLHEPEPLGESPRSERLRVSREQHRTVRALRDLDTVARDDYRDRERQRKSQSRVARASQIAVDMLPGDDGITNWVGATNGLHPRYIGQRLWFPDQEDSPALVQISQMYLDGSVDVTTHEGQKLRLPNHTLTGLHHYLSPDECTISAPDRDHAALEGGRITMDPWARVEWARKACSLAYNAINAQRDAQQDLLLSHFEAKMTQIACDIFHGSNPWKARTVCSCSADDAGLLDGQPGFIAAGGTAARRDFDDLPVTLASIEGCAPVPPFWSTCSCMCDCGFFDRMAEARAQLESDTDEHRMERVIYVSHSRACSDRRSYRSFEFKLHVLREQELTRETPAETLSAACLQPLYSVQHQCAAELKRCKDEWKASRNELLRELSQVAERVEKRARDEQEQLDALNQRPSKLRRIASRRKRLDPAVREARRARRRDFLAFFNQRRAEAERDHERDAWSDGRVCRYHAPTCLCGYCKVLRDRHEIARSKAHCAHLKELGAYDLIAPHEW